MATNMVITRDETPFSTVLFEIFGSFRVKSIYYSEEGANENIGEGGTGLKIRKKITNKKNRQR